MRGATITGTETTPPEWISIHAPHAGCDTGTPPFPETLQISIHAPHAGCDLATGDLVKQLGDISIHAPHAGCDRC